MPTLDEAASLLVQLDPAVEVDLRELRRALFQIVSTGAYATNVKTLLVEAMLSIDDPPPEPLGRERLLDGIRVLLERAMLAHDTGETGPILPVVARTPAARALVVPDDADPALLAEFVGEAREGLHVSETALMQYERDPGDLEAINTVFRAFHTIKGTAAFLGLDRIADLAHQGESVLSGMRAATGRRSPEAAELIFLSIDVLMQALAAVERAEIGVGVELSDGIDDLAEALRAAASATEGDVSPTRGEGRATPIEAADSVHPESRRGAPVDSLVRVRTTRLDQLVELTGELVIATTMAAQHRGLREGIHQDLEGHIARADALARAVQELGLAMRMVPLLGAFQKAARIVRDLSSRSGKAVDLVTYGEGTEIDRSIADAISDPLVHMLRNAIDHGIEPADDRMRAGKPARGTITLTASHAGGSVVVTLRDDGRGLDRPKILRCARDRGLVDASREFSDSEIDALIFHPGFSTADLVTELSGRGVGMDVARRTIEAMRGRVEIASTPGEGTCFTIRLPLTLAVSDTMLVGVGAERYLLPIDAIRESLRPEAGDLRAIAGVGDVLLLRGDVLPIIRLHRLFAVPEGRRDPCLGILVVVGNGRERAALFVDELLGQFQVVARSLGVTAGRVAGISGGAILGDGRIGLILDVEALLETARAPGAGWSAKARAVA